MAKRKKQPSRPDRPGKRKSKTTGKKRGPARRQAGRSGPNSNRSSSSPRKHARKPDDGTQRLQRVLASAGFGSRRECETLIEDGRVEVDGEIVIVLGTKVDPEKQKIFVDGQRVKLKKPQYFIVNKPPGVISTSRDPAGRMRVIDLINTDQRVYNVGRLDKSSEGLILVTNDGDLANQLTHPRFRVPKKYLVQVKGHPERQTMDALLDGVYLAEGLAKAASARIKKRQREYTWLEIVLEEGRNREIRRLLAKLGHKVITLRRVAIGPIQLGDLPVGAHRRLEPSEVKSLQHYIKAGPKRRTAKRKHSQRRSPRRRTSDELVAEKESRRKTPKRKTARVGSKPSSRTGGAKKKTSKSRKQGAESGRRGAARSQKQGGKVRSVRKSTKRKGRK